MSERIEIRAAGPKPRLIENVVAVLVRGGLIAYPTDSGYALGWRTWFGPWLFGGIPDRLRDWIVLRMMGVRS